MTSRKRLEINRIDLIDAIEGLRRLEDESIDLIVTDPPYNIAAPNRRTMKGGRPVSTMKVWGHWDRYHPFDYDVLIMTVIAESYRADTRIVQDELGIWIIPGLP